MSYAIMRIGKCKKEKLAQIHKHHTNRNNLKNREHKELEHLNRTWQRDGLTLSQNVRQQIKEQEKRTGKKVRKDAVVCLEIVMTFSPDAVGTFSMQQWYEENRKWLEREFKGSKIIQLNLEFDETTPHIHAFVIPLDENENINAKKVMGDKKKFIQRQDDYAACMAVFRLQRGVSKELTKSKHKSLSQHYREQNMKIKEQEKKIEINDKIIRKQMADNILSEDIRRTEKVGYYKSEIADDIFK